MVYGHSSGIKRAQAVVLPPVQMNTDLSALNHCARFVFVSRAIDYDYTSSLDTDLTRNTRAPHFTPQHWLLCHMGLY